MLIIKGNLSNYLKEGKSPGFFIIKGELTPRLHVEVVTFVIVDGEAAGSGIGTSTTEALIRILASATGNGVGEATTEAILDVLAEADGSGIGLGSTEALIKVLAAAAASGEGLGEAEALLEVIAEAQGSGIGTLILDANLIPYECWQLIQEVPTLRAKIVELELALEPKARFRI